MFFYLLYWIGEVSSRWLPRSAAYGAARALADFCYFRSAKDREAVRQNLQAILGEEKVPPRMVKEVFRNFGLYLVDFFRFKDLTPDEIRKSVRLEGLDEMEKVLAKGCGAIGLTAHLGNFELAGAVLALLGFPVSALVLVHQNPRVNAFFCRQRKRVGVTGIALQGSGSRGTYEKCRAVLSRNEILALVGDRDFFEKGLPLSFLGKEVRIPTGPAAFSVRMKAPIVPGFLVREKEGSYRFILEAPMAIPEGVSREEAIRSMTQQCVARMSHYIREYPTQWYMFQKFWSPGPATIL